MASAVQKGGNITSSNDPGQISDRNRHCFKTKDEKGLGMQPCVITWVQIQYHTQHITPTTHNTHTHPHTHLQIQCNEWVSFDLALFWKLWRILSKQLFFFARNGLYSQISVEESGRNIKWKLMNMKNGMCGPERQCQRTEEKSSRSFHICTQSLQSILKEWVHIG